MVKFEGRKAGQEVIIKDNPVSRWLFTNTTSGWLWLVLRLYLGWAWLSAGWGKLSNEVWIGDKAGVAIKGFMGGALENDIPGWYAWFIETLIIPNAAAVSYVVVFGEILVGLGLIVGLLTGIAAFFGALMNFSFLLAGTVSTNPEMLVIAIFIIMAWKVAGWYGLDRWALPKLGTPWTVRDKS